MSVDKPIKRSERQADPPGRIDPSRDWPEDTDQRDDMDPGAVLRAARGAAHYSIEYVAQRLKLPTRVVEAIEANDLRRFPTPVYLRGYIRNYAKLLKIDPAPLLRDYSILKADSVAPAVVERGGPVSADVEQRAGRSLTVLWVGLLLAALMLLVWQWPVVEKTFRNGPNQTPAVDETAPTTVHGPKRTADVNAEDTVGSQDGSASQDSPAAEVSPGPTTPASVGAGAGEGGTASGWPTPPERVRAGRGDTVAELSGGGGSGGNPPNSAVYEDSLSVGGATEPAAADAGTSDDVASVPGRQSDVGLSAPHPPAAGAQSEPPVPRELFRARRITPDGDDELWFESTEDCRVAVLDMEGAFLYEDLLSGRQSLRLLGEGPFQIRLGYAPGVSVEYNGEPVPLAPHTSGTAASLVVGQ